MFSKFLGGATAGVLASLTTTLIVEACKVLLINPDTYPFGERVRSTAKILATGASVVVGVLVQEALADLPLGTLPLAEDVVPVFCRIAGSPVSASRDPVLDNRKGPAKAGPLGYSCSKQLRM